jgi:hypothetical protein
LPEAAVQALKTRNRAPFAKDAKPLHPLRSLCAPCVTKTPQRGEKTRKLFPHNSRHLFHIPQWKIRCLCDGFGFGRLKSTKSTEIDKTDRNRPKPTETDQNRPKPTETEAAILNS